MNQLAKSNSGILNIDTVVKSAKQGSTSRTLKNIEIICKVCDEQVSRNSTDFSIATIGKLSKASGGVAPQSIRNRTGSKFRAIIDAYDRAYGRKVIREVVEQNSWVDRISENDIRWLVKDLIAENRKLKNENDVFKSNVNLMVDLRENAPSSDDGRFSLSFTSSEISSLTHFISEIELEGKGWLIDKRGRVKDLDGNEIAKPGFVDALRKILDHDKLLMVDDKRNS